MSKDNMDIQSYLNNCVHYKRLNAEEELQLAIEYKATHDPKIAHKLLMSNVKLISKCATDYCTNWDIVMDLVQEGNVGFIIGIDKFDPTRGYRLTTYALWWAKAHIWRYVMNNWRIIKIGNRVQERKLFYRLEKERQALLSEGIEPSSALLAQKLNVDRNEIDHLGAYLSNAELSLDLPNPGLSGRERTSHKPLHEVISDKTQIIENIAGKQHFISKVREILDTLRPSLDYKEIIVLDNRLLAIEPETLQEIGARLLLTRERIRQIEKSLLAKIKKKLINYQELIGAAQTDFE